MSKLSHEQIEQRLAKVPNWVKKNDEISRTFQFKGFPDSIKFVDRMAVEAEKMNHHPDIDIRWNKVTLKLTSHEDGGLTERDFLLAEECDGIFSRL